MTDNDWMGQSRLRLWCDRVPPESRDVRDGTWGRHHRVYDPAEVPDDRSAPCLAEDEDGPCSGTLVVKP